MGRGNEVARSLALAVQFRSRHGLYYDRLSLGILHSVFEGVLIAEAVTVQE